MSSTPRLASFPLIVFLVAVFLPTPTPAQAPKGAGITMAADAIPKISVSLFIPARAATKIKTKIPPASTSACGAAVPA